MAARVEVVGVAALAADFRHLAAPAGPLDQQLARAGRVAVTPLAAVARSAFPQVSGRLASDVRVTNSRSGAAVRTGRNSIRYAGWVEFGGHRKAPHDSSRDYLSQGRYLFPHAQSLAGPAARSYSTGTQRALDGYRWTNTGTDPGGVHD
jgi:hypothetical protein